MQRREHHPHARQHANRQQQKNRQTENSFLKQPATPNNAAPPLQPHLSATHFSASHIFATHFSASNVPAPHIFSTHRVLGRTACLTPMFRSPASRNQSRLTGNAPGSCTPQTFSHPGLGNMPYDSIARKCALIIMVSHALPQMQWALPGAKRLERGSLLPLCLHAPTMCLSPYHRKRPRARSR